MENNSQWSENVWKLLKRKFRFLHFLITSNFSSCSNSSSSSNSNSKYCQVFLFFVFLFLLFLFRHICSEKIQFLFMRRIIYHVAIKTKYTWHYIYNIAWDINFLKQKIIADIKMLTEFVMYSLRCKYVHMFVDFQHCYPLSFMPNNVLVER